MQPKNITVANAAIRWGVGRTTLYTLIAAGHLKSIKYGSRRLIDVESGDAFFDSLAHGTAGRVG